MWPNNPTPRHISRGKHVSKGYEKSIYAPQYYCSTNYNSQDIQEPKYPLTEEGIKKMWYIYTMEY